MMTTEQKQITALAEYVAVSYHTGQYRTGGDPYIHHVARVAGQVKGRYPHEAVAWLHDVVEDTEFTLGELALMFPIEVFNAVYALTRIKDETYAEYIENLCTIDNEVAIQVKLADLLDNLRDLEAGHQRDKYELSKLLLDSRN